jgi:hypothetical protein
MFFEKMMRVKLTPDFLNESDILSISIADASTSLAKFFLFQMLSLAESLEVNCLSLVPYIGNVEKRSWVFHRDQELRYLVELPTGHFAELERTLKDSEQDDCVLRVCYWEKFSFWKWQWQNGVVSFLFSSSNSRNRGVFSEENEAVIQSVVNYCTDSDAMKTDAITWITQDLRGRLQSAEKIGQRVSPTLMELLEYRNLETVLLKLRDLNLISIND